MPTKRTVFFISDRTGITAEMLGNSLLTQFEDFQFRRVTVPFIDSPEKVDEVIRQVNATGAAEGRRPIVFSSVVDEAASDTIRARAEALTLDLFQIFIAPLETELAAKSSHAAGRSHGIANSHEYFTRMEAINFTQAHDDGAATREHILRSGDVIALSDVLLVYGEGRDGPLAELAIAADEELDTTQMKPFE